MSSVCGGDESQVPCLSRRLRPICPRYCN